MSNQQHLGLDELGQRVQAMSDPVPDPRLRPYQAPPIPIGPASNGRPATSYEPVEKFRVTPVAHQAPQPNAPQSGLQRAISAVRSTIPLVQKLLPLLDGNFATAIGALVAPHTHPHPAPPPLPVQVDLEPMERGLAEVRNSHRELRGQVLEQVISLKRVEDQLERVREATDRNTLEQQEFVDDLRAVGSRIRTFAIIGLALLVISLGLNIYLLLQLQHILR